MNTTKLEGTYENIRDLAIEYGIINYGIDFENMTETQIKKLRKVCKRHGIEYID
jgi:hypothetical protein